MFFFDFIAFFSFLTKATLRFSDVLHKENYTYLYQNSIKFYALDFSERCSEEMMFLLTLSVHLDEKKCFPREMRIWRLIFKCVVVHACLARKKLLHHIYPAALLHSQSEQRIRCNSQKMQSCYWWQEIRRFSRSLFSITLLDMQSVTLNIYFLVVQLFYMYLFINKLWGAVVAERLEPRTSVPEVPCSSPGPIDKPVWEKNISPPFFIDFFFFLLYKQKQPMQCM